jgi:hypothetical protein
MVKTAVVYGSETWSVTEEGCRLNKWERKILKRIYGPVLEQGI